MNVEDVLAGKAQPATEAPVATVSPDETVAQAVSALKDHNVGALVVSADGSAMEGIISERDVVRRLADESSAALDRPISEVMTSPVHTCAMSDDLAELAHQMTHNRIRHLVVEADGAMVGIISIGDVVKSRLDQLEAERQRLARENDQITEYIQTGR
ncbi:MAG: CBS domain-containing protein [Microthrixaceae bacterium]